MEMTFLNGFFLVNFLPFGIIILAGILLFFKGNYKQKKFYYPLLFVIIVLIVIGIWRMPVLIDRRYAMPTIVQGIVISTFLLMEFPDILKKFKIPYATTITRVLIVILLIACLAKTMRFQGKKDYIRDIAETIKINCQRNNIQGDVVLLVFGNLGGSLELDDNIKTTYVENKYFNDKFADTEYQFNLLKGTLDPESLKIQYTHVYLLCAEKTSGGFHAAWEKKYGDSPELVFEYVNAKRQIAYRLYRISSQRI